ncbi:MAG: endo alpha-1,4 polygalactosaminidase [Propionibacteriales bacterium]|nr:endo alpha-1,4 polygalactosaminidase [Propionibacteriales bacterium]
MQWRAACAAGLMSLTVAAPAHAAVAPLPVGTHVDYQLGGSRSVTAAVGIVVRDRTARPVPGKYNVCYVNGFQTQLDEGAFWAERPDLILRKDGRPVVDAAWGEKLLDTRSPAKRDRLAVIVGRWITGCARSGFRAVEFDNLDSFSRSQGLITPAQNKAMAALLVARAHRAGLAAGQKNWSEWNGRVVGFDFAVAEECGRYAECARYVRHYGRRVLAIEYRQVDFARTCSRWGSRLAVVLRDRDLTSTGLRRFC